MLSHVGNSAATSAASLSGIAITVSVARCCNAASSSSIPGVSCGPGSTTGGVYSSQPSSARVSADGLAMTLPSEQMMSRPSE